MVSRRWFIGGAAAFGAFGGNRFFACFGGEPLERPKLRLGVVSDVHVCVYGSDKGVWGTELLKAAFEYYRDRQVDAIVIPGDLADQGYGEGLRAVAKTWREVFPDDKLPDGRKVEKVFVFGNHDFGGAWYTDWGKKRYASDAERAADNLRIHPEKLWREAFEEDYSPFYRKEIRGFTFFGQHWDNGSRQQESGKVYPFGDLLKEHLADPKNRPDPSKPFFYVQHPHPKNTCYGSWAWGHDDGVSTEVLSAYPNAIALSGHSHYALTDERTIWQGAFTSAGCSSLRYGGTPADEMLPSGYENSGAGRNSWERDALKMMGAARDGRSRHQGTVWSVYADRIVVNRVDFPSRLPMGPDWVMPLPAAEPRPFSFVERARKIGAPEFAPGAKLEVSFFKAKTRGSKSPDRKHVIKSVEKDAFRVVIPPAVAKDGARVWRYRIEVGSLTDPQVKYVLASGYGQSLSAKAVSAPSECVFALDEVPRGKNKVITVTPENCFGRQGRALSIRARL